MKDAMKYSDVLEKVVHFDAMCYVNYALKQHINESPVVAETSRLLFLLVRVLLYHLLTSISYRIHGSADKQTHVFYKSYKSPIRIL